MFLKRPQSVELASLETQGVRRAFAEMPTVLPGELAQMTEAAGKRDGRDRVPRCGEAQQAIGLFEPAVLQKALRSQSEVAAKAGLQMPQRDAELVGDARQSQGFVRARADQFAG